MRLAEFMSRDGRKEAFWPDECRVAELEGEKIVLVESGGDVINETLDCTYEEARDELNAARNWVPEPPRQIVSQWMDGEQPEVETTTTVCEHTFTPPLDVDMDDTAPKYPGATLDDVHGMLKKCIRIIKELSD